MNLLTDAQKEELKTLPQWFLNKLKAELAAKKEADRQLEQEMERLEKFKQLVADWKEKQDAARDAELMSLRLRLEETQAEVAKREDEENRKHKLSLAAVEQQEALKNEEIQNAEHSLEQRKKQLKVLQQQIEALRTQIRMKQELLHLGSVTGGRGRLQTLSVFGNKPRESVVKKRLTMSINNARHSILKDLEATEQTTPKAPAKPKQAEAPVVGDNVKTINTPETAEPLNESVMESIPVSQLCDAMLDIMLDPEFKLVGAILEALRASEQDRVAKILAEVFDSQDMIFDLLEFTIKEEVKRTLDIGTLFRSNSMASRIMSAYGRNIGMEYMKQYLKPLIDKIIAQNEYLEVDPMKFVDGLIEAQRNSFVIPREQISNNIARILELTQEVLQRVLMTFPSCPVEFNHVCRLLKECVGEKFPDGWKTAIGGFIFLRLICPVIYRPPDEFGYDFAGIPSNARRTLVLIAKILQNLANYMPKFSEESMHAFSSFVEKNIPNVDKFFTQMAEIPANKADSPKPPYKTGELLRELIKILAPLQSRILPSLVNEPRTFIQRWRFDKGSKLSTILDRLGPPVEGIRYNNTDPNVISFHTLLTEDDITVKAIHDSMENLGIGTIEETDMARNMLNIFEAKQRSILLIVATLQVHLNHQSRTGKHFLDGLPAKIYVRWSREICKDKLRDAFVPALETLRASINEIHNPQVQAVVAATFLSRCIALIPTLPTPMWRLLNAIKSIPQLGDHGVIKFLFNLLICRALAEPDMYHISQTEVDKNVKKGLSLVTEIIMACATGQEDSSSLELSNLTKEFIPSLRDAINKWLSTNNTNVIGPVSFQVAWEDVERSLFAVHKFIYSNLSRITLILEHTSTMYKWVSFTLPPLLDVIFRAKV